MKSSQLQKCQKCMHFHNAFLHKLRVLVQKNVCTFTRSASNFTIVRSLLHNNIPIGTFANKGEFVRIVGVYPVH